MFNREMERDRIVDQEGMLYNQFNSATDFELIEKYAKVIGIYSVCLSNFLSLGFKCTTLE
jgi:hypothetical protein